MLFMQAFGSSASAVLMVNLKSSEQSLVLYATDFKAETVSITSFFLLLCFFLLSHITKRKKLKYMHKQLCFFFNVQHFF